MLYVWLGLMIAFVIVELATPQLVSIWFALGSLGAMIAASLSASLWLQLIVFVAVSGIMVFVTRPLYKKIIMAKQVPTNTDRLIGQTAVVTEDIDNLDAKGAVKVCGQIWTARSANDEKIPADTRVTVERIEGVKLIVKI